MNSQETAYGSTCLGSYEPKDVDYDQSRKGSITSKGINVNQINRDE